MKKLTSALLCMVLLLPLFISVGAAEPKIVDNADLLTSQEESLLEHIAQQIAQDYGMDVVIVTVDGLDGKSPEAFADDYFDDNGYGIGSSFSGVLLLISMEERDWAISTCGDAIYALTDYGIQQLFSAFAPDLSAGRYFEAFSVYLDELPRYFKALQNDDPIDGNQGYYDGPGSYYPGTSDDVVYYPEKITAGEVFSKILLALVIGCAVGGVAVWAMSSPMKSAKMQSGADHYFIRSSYAMRSHQDFYLYGNTSRVRRSQNNNGGGHGGRGGGSSVHRSSGGRSHGGGHGKF